MSFGVMENSPVPREETRSKVLSNARVRKCILIFVVKSRNLKGGIGSLFDPYVNAIGAAVILPITYGSELLYLWIWHDLHTLAVPRDSPHDNQYACVI